MKKTTEQTDKWLFPLSFGLALIASLVPLSESLNWIRPEWMALLVIYWCLNVPERMGIGLCWCLGFLLDPLKGGFLGQYAFAFALIGYVTLHVGARIKQFPLLQQAIFVFLLIAFSELVLIWLRNLVADSAFDWRYGLPAITSMLVWPLLAFVMTGARQRWVMR